MSVKQNKEEICNGSCIYFPADSFMNAKYEADENGVKIRSSSPSCLYDDHKIESWEPCKNIRVPSHTSIKSKIICFMGMSACGKDTAVRIANEKNIPSVISHTTRPMRTSEQEGREYFFLTQQEFLDRETANYFFEYRKYHTNFDGNKTVWYYGTSKLELSRQGDKCIVLDVEGFKKLVSYYGEENVVCVYIDASEKTRKKRSQSRGSFSQEEWNRRQKEDSKTLNDDFANEYADYVIENNSSDKIFRLKIMEILEKEGFVNE